MFNEFSVCRIVPRYHRNTEFHRLSHISLFTNAFCNIYTIKWASIKRSNIISVDEPPSLKAAIRPMKETRIVKTHGSCGPLKPLVLHHFLQYTAAPMRYVHSTDIYFSIQMPCFRFTSYGIMKLPLNLPLKMAEWRKLRLMHLYRSVDVST